MEGMYHGCFFKNADGTNKIIKTGETCLTPTDECFFKNPCDVRNGVKTRSRTKNEPTVGLESFNQYHSEKLPKYRIKGWSQGEE